MAIQTFEEIEVYAGFKYEASLSTSLLSYALTIAPNHIAFGSLAGTNYAGNDLPDSGYNTSTFYINCRNANSISVYLTPDDTSLSPQLNKYTGTWSGWQSIGGDNKFIKGQAIPFYDTDGETLINSVLPENLVYYDGTSGEDVANNYILASPSANVSTPTSGTKYYPNLSVVNGQKGNGFEVANNGDIKCNKNGIIKVTAFVNMNGGNSAVGKTAQLAKNRIEIENTQNSTYGAWGQNMECQWVGSVVAGDTITFFVSPGNNNSTDAISLRSTILCEYIEDYYITQHTVENTTKEVLFSGGTSTTTTANLSNSAANYDYLKVIFINNDGVYSSVDVIHPDGKKITAWVNTTTNEGSYAKTAIFLISGTTITNQTTQKQHYFSGANSLANTSVQNVGIYAVIGERATTDSGELIEQQNIYSTSEIEIGRWIDGSPLYRKVLTGTNSAQSFTINMGLVNADKIVNVDVRLIRAASYTQNTNIGGYWNSSSDYFNWYMSTPSSNQLTIRGGSDWPKRPYDYAVILEYTKTIN